MRKSKVTVHSCYTIYFHYVHSQGTNPSPMWLFSSAPAKVSLGKVQNPELPLLIKLESTISIHITLAME